MAIGTGPTGHQENKLKAKGVITMKKTMTINVTEGWKFTATTATLMNHSYTVKKWAIDKKGDVWGLTVIEGVAIRMHLVPSMPVYHEAMEAAMTYLAKANETESAEAKAAAEFIAEQPKAVPAVKAEAPAPKAKAKPASQASGKAEAKPAVQAKPEAPKAKAPAVQPKAAPADFEAMLGKAITGSGWAITLDTAADRTRVTFEGTPSAKQKAAVEAAGFYYSNQLKSWNKKLTRKAYRAALELSEQLAAIA